MVDEMFKCDHCPLFLVGVEEDKEVVKKKLFLRVGTQEYQSYVHGNSP